MHATLLQMNLTAGVYMHEYFGAEFSQFVLVIMSIIVHDIHNRGEQYDVGKSPISFYINR